MLKITFEREINADIEKSFEVIANFENFQKLFPEFYTNPTSIDAMVDHIVGKCLDQFGIEHDLFTRWGSK